MTCIMLGLGSLDQKVEPNTLAAFSAKSQVAGEFTDVKISVARSIAPFFEVQSVKVGTQECLEGGPVPASVFEPDALNRSLGVSWNGTTPISIVVRNVDASAHGFIASVRADQGADLDLD